MKKAKPKMQKFDLCGEDETAHSTINSVEQNGPIQAASALKFGC
jgi:hypothetical protein